MPVQQSDIDALNTALSSGEKVVRIGDKLVEYHSPEQIIKARNDLQQQMAAELRVVTGVQRPKIVYHTQKSRGY